MKTAVFLVLFAVSAAAASADGVGWSPVVNGLRARLVVLPPDKPGSPFCRVMIEMENVRDAMGQMKIRFAPGRLELRVTDKAGRELRASTGPYDGIAPLWEPTLLPYAGTIRFQVSFPGLGYRPNIDRTIVDIGPTGAWIIPQDGAGYGLSGRLVVEKKEGDHPIMDWSGSLDLPRVPIPTAR